MFAYPVREGWWLWQDPFSAGCKVVSTFNILKLNRLFMDMPTELRRIVFFTPLEDITVF